MHMVRDTGELRRWYVRAAWQEGGEYTLTIPKGALENVAREQNDSIVEKYTVLEAEKYATVLIHVRGKENTRYIIQQLDGSGQLQQERRDVTTGDVRFNYVPAGEIRFRVIEDTNGNGRWDTGNLVERRDPERAEMYENDQGEGTFSTKANWEIEFTMDMNRLFAPVTMKSLTQLLDRRELQRQQREEARRAEERKKQSGTQNRNNGMMQQGSGNGMFNSAGDMFNTFR